jgi:hypothetical protein
MCTVKKDLKIIEGNILDVFTLRIKQNSRILFLPLQAMPASFKTICPTKWLRLQMRKVQKIRKKLFNRKPLINQ